MKIKLQNILVHIAGWMIFLSMPPIIFSLIGPLHDGSDVPHPPLHRHHGIFHMPPALLAFNLSLIAFYYINSLLLIPRLLGKRQKLRYAFAIIGCFIAIILLQLAAGMIFWPMYKPPVDPESDRHMIAIRVLFSILLFAIIFIVSTGIRLIREWYGAEQRTKEIELERTTAELSFLKAQINPHFLFNTLNNIYSLSVKGSEQTSEAVLLLADMMRYVLSEAQNDFVPLEAETGYLSKFIELQSIRLTDKVTIVYHLSGETGSNIIAPLILVPFIENAFKFGISTHEPGTISIVIEIANDILKMKVSNKVFPLTHLIAKSSGIGLINVKRRLALLYPDRYKLHIAPQAEDNYIVALEINLSP
jgi:two-component system LytT family sensor kinase